MIISLVDEPYREALLDAVNYYRTRFNPLVAHRAEDYLALKSIITSDYADNQALTIAVSDYCKNLKTGMVFFSKWHIATGHSRLKNAVFKIMRQFPAELLLERELVQAKKMLKFAEVVEKHELVLKVRELEAELEEERARRVVAERGKRELEVELADLRTEYNSMEEQLSVAVVKVHKLELMVESLMELRELVVEQQRTIAGLKVEVERMRHGPEAIRAHQ